MNPLRRLWLIRAAACAASGIAQWPAIHAASADSTPDSTRKDKAGDEDPLHSHPPSLADDGRIAVDRLIRFPRDHGAHTTAAIEWWYATGWIAASTRPPTHASADAPAPVAIEPTSKAATTGWQLTVFRQGTGLAADLPGRFAPRHLLLAQLAITDCATGSHLHAQRIARWSGDVALADAHAARVDADLLVDRWHWHRDPATGVWRFKGNAREIGVDLDLRLTPTAGPLLQGESGWSRKGPGPDEASLYYSLPQLAASARLSRNGRELEAHGKGWLDHEWTNRLLPRDAIGWDWLGINLDDGSALTVFRLRRRDGSPLWAGGSFRGPGSTAVRSFRPTEVTLRPGRIWTSAATRARYPVEWQIHTPAGSFGLRALIDDQEMPASGGPLYWEGLSELLDAADRRIGLGYLELTGYGENAGT